MKVYYKGLIKLFYTALMVFLVFTFANSLLQGLVNNFCIELFLYTLMWLFLVIQTTFAYVHIMKVKSKDYTNSAFLSDRVDIGIAVYVCAAISTTNTIAGYNELTNYSNLSVPFIILAINQFSWYVIVREFNTSALFRIGILFFGMLAVSVSEWIYHGFWNLILIVTLIVLLGVLRAIDKSPKAFDDKVTVLWMAIKRKDIVKRLLYKNKDKQK